MANVLQYCILVFLVSAEYLRHTSANAHPESIQAYIEGESFALTEFRGLVSNLTYREFMKRDAYLIRWLMEAEFDVQLAFENFSKFIEWRRSKNVDLVVFEDFSDIDQRHQFSVDMTDKEGHPVVWAPFGSYDIRRITIAGLMERYQLFLVRMFELAEVFLHSINATQLSAIYDLAGFNLKSGGCLKCLSMIPEASANCHTHYPGLFANVFTINTPQLFLHIITIAESFMTERAKKSLFVYGFDKNEWIPVLYSGIEPDQLPIEYGGVRPPFYTQAGKEAQLKFIKNLVQKAREAVRKDLPEEHDSNDFPNVLSSTEQAHAHAFTSHTKDDHLHSHQDELPQKEEPGNREKHHHRHHHGQHQRAHSLNSQRMTQATSTLNPEAEDGMQHVKTSRKGFQNAIAVTSGTCTRAVAFAVFITAIVSNRVYFLAIAAGI